MCNSNKIARKVSIFRSLQSLGLHIFQILCLSQTFGHRYLVSCDIEIAFRRNCSKFKLKDLKTSIQQQIEFKMQSICSLIVHNS